MCFICRKWNNIHGYYWDQSKDKTLSLLYHFGGEYSVNVRNWSKQRFWPRLWSVCMRWNLSDFHQFSWNPAFFDIIFINWFNLFTQTTDFLFLTLKSWFYSCRQPANIADIHFHSLCQAPTPQGQKTHVIVFTGQKFHLQLVIGQMLISHLWEKLSNLSEFLQSTTINFFSNLAWSKSQCVYYKPMCTDTHFKNFGPSKTLPFSKYTTKISSPRLPVWDTSTICA